MAQIKHEDKSKKITFWEIATKTRMGSYLTDVETNFFLKNIDFSKCITVCDIGAGAGKFSLLAAQRNVDVVAVDIDTHGLQRLRAKNNLINVVLADARYLPLKEDTFDAAFMIEVLDYIPESERVLSECNGILKNRGLLVFSFGNRDSVKSRFRKLQGKQYMHSYRKVTQDLDKTGFAALKDQGFNWLPFNRTSENPSIPLLAAIEKLLGLRKISRLGPWVLMCAVKL